MQIRDEESRTRVDDALKHDELMVMLNDPETSRPLLTLSVTKEGTGIIEYEPGDLAAGIRQLNHVLSTALHGEIAPSDIELRSGSGQ